MSDDIDSIRRELEEVRRLKEELRREVEATRREREDQRLQRDDVRKRREEAYARRAKRVKPPKPPRAPRPARIASVDLDLEGLTESLETMMDGLGHQIEMSLKDIDGLKVPGIRIRDGFRRTSRRKDQRQEIESIAPERVATIVAPLGSEERLKILDYLKTGGKSFNDIENYTGKTGSSLTHHLNPLIDAGYVVKGEVRGTYYVTVEGRLAYRLAQWLTHRVEKQRERIGNNTESEVDVEFDDTDQETDDAEKAEEHLEQLDEELEVARGALEYEREKLEDERDALEDEREKLEEAREDFEESLEEEDEDEDLDDLDWDD